MAKSIIAPCRYYQGSGLLTDAYRYVSHIGRNFTVICDDTVKTILQKKLEIGFRSAGRTCKYVTFNGECSMSEVLRLVDIVAEDECDGIIGAGGGKTLDTAKLVGEYCGCPVITVPTIASNDAACACLSSLYTDDGTFLKMQKLRTGPEVVLADAEILSSGPLKYLIAGMGEAVTTYYDAISCEYAGVQNYTGGSRSNTVMMLAKLCRDLILENGEEAVRGYDDKSTYNAFAKVIEAIIYLSAVGYQNCGCAASQAVYGGLTTVIKPFPALQGEGTAYGCLVQLLMEYSENGAWDTEEWEQLTEFHRSVGLPRKLKDLGINDINDELMMKIAKASCKPGTNMGNMPFLVTEEKVFNAIKTLENMNL